MIFLQARELRRFPSCSEVRNFKNFITLSTFTHTHIHSFVVFLPLVFYVPWHKCFEGATVLITVCALEYYYIDFAVANDAKMLQWKLFTKFWSGLALGGCFVLIYHQAIQNIGIGINIEKRCNFLKPGSLASTREELLFYPYVSYKELRI